MTTKIPALALALASGCLLAACSTPSTISTRDGRTDYTADAPNTDPDSDFVTYKKGGREVKVNKSDVTKIEEVD
ncbi:MAG TPA: YgdI/YgdR family lipoprotein [Castellaniella sp.]|nr:YgdI/YgdR family lipoprotein [Castellaniella sp.]